MRVASGVGETAEETAQEAADLRHTRQEALDRLAVAVAKLLGDQDLGLDLTERADGNGQVVREFPRSEPAVRLSDVGRNRDGCSPDLSG